MEELNAIKLAAATNFEEARRLLEIYHQEVAQTEIFDYPTHWKPQASIPSSSISETPAIANGESVHNFDLSCDLPPIPPSVMFSFCPHYLGIDSLQRLIRA